MQKELEMNNDTNNKMRGNELVINWHITEVCNYNCHYCFAKWGRPNELHSSKSAINALLDELAGYFIRGRPSIKLKLDYSDVRINFAGGEPMLLGSKFFETLALAKEKGFKTSVITNGSYLSEKFLDIQDDSLDMVGISFDSQSASQRRRLGRIDRKGSSIGSQQLAVLVEAIREKHKGVSVKINTVVNALNYEEDFAALMRELNPDKWKLLQVLPYGNDELLITKQQFDSFVERHTGLGLNIAPESSKTMIESYLMIDPKGRFYQNRDHGSGYIFSDCINEVGTSNALSQIRFNVSLFKSRYAEETNQIIIQEVA